MTFAATSPGRHLVDGTVRLFLAEALVFPTGLVTAAFLTRSLHPTGYGLFTLAAVLIAWLEWIPPALFSRTAVKFLSESQDLAGMATAVLRLYLGVGMALAASVWLLAPWIAKLMTEPSLTSYLRLFTIEIPIFAAAYAHRNILVGRGQYRRQSLVSAVRWSGRLVLVLAFVAGGLSVRGAVLGSIGASLAEFAAVRWFVRPSLFGRTSVPMRQICAFAAPLFLSAICARLFDRVDLLTLKSLGASAAQAGFYGAAQNVALAPNLFALSFTPLLLGTLSRLLREGDREKAIEIGDNAIRTVICLVPFAAVAFAVSGDLVHAIFGASFAPATPLIGPLVSAALAMVLSSASSAMVVAADKPRWVLLSTAPLPFVAMAGHLALIPRFGPVGAASVTMGTAMLGAALSLIQVYRLWRVHPPWATCLRSAVIATAAWGIGSYWHGVLVVKLAGIAGFIAAAFAAMGEFDIPAACRRRFLKAAEAAVPIAALLLVAIALQWRSGAFRAEFAGYPDEAAHYVTGLMIHDYWTTGVPANPLTFARNYYLHYPRVAFGHWPPVFHTVLAVWMLLFTADRVPVMVLMALLSAAIGFLIYRFLEPRMGRIAALGFAVLWLLLPLVQQYTSLLMSEMALTLLCFAAALVYARYLKSGAASDAAWFGAIAAVAVLTKANGWMLGILPPLAILLTQRFYLIRRAAFWLPALIVLPPGVAWYSVTFKQAHHGWVGTTSVRYMTGHVLQYNGAATLRIAGWGILLAALAGVAIQTAPSLRGRKMDPEWACLVVLWIAALAFHSFITPVQEERHLLVSVPSMTLFAAAGFHWATRRVHLPGAVAVAAAFALFAAGVPTMFGKRVTGYSELADLLCAQKQWDHAAFLIQSDQAAGEGPFVAEIAMRDARPQHFVIRRTKWLPQGADLLNELERLPVSVMVIESQRASDSPLIAAIAAAPERVQLLWSGSTIRAYQLPRAAPGAPGKFRLDLRRASVGVNEN